MRKLFATECYAGRLAGCERAGYPSGGYRCDLAHCHLLSFSDCLHGHELLLCCGTYNVSVDAIMLCDLLAEPLLARHMDPEDLYDVIRIYQATCARIIR